MAQKFKQLNSYWKPIFRIVERIAPLVYKIRDQVSGKVKQVHVENLRAADPEAAWDEVREAVENVVPLDYKEAENDPPIRVQPVRQAKLFKPMTPVITEQPSEVSDYVNNQDNGENGSLRNAMDTQDSCENIEHIEFDESGELKRKRSDSLSDNEYDDGNCRYNLRSKKYARINNINSEESKSFLDSLVRKVESFFIDKQPHPVETV